MRSVLNHSRMINWIYLASEIKENPEYKNKTKNNKKKNKKEKMKKKGEDYNKKEDCKEVQMTKHSE